MKIVDRADGRVLLDTTDELEELLYELVEDIQCFQISELFLQSLTEQGVDWSITEALRVELTKSPTLFGGGVLASDGDAAATLSGVLTGSLGKGLGGLALTLQDKEGQAVAWAFSKTGGDYELKLSSLPQDGELELLVSGRGGLVLYSLELVGVTDGSKELDPISILCLEGRVCFEGGEGLAAGRIEAWGTWAVTDSEGRFSLPVEALEGELVLEVFAASGQPLGGYQKINFGEGESKDLGDRVVPRPDPNWPDSGTPLIAGFDYRPDPLFPGVSDRPLG